MQLRVHNSLISELQDAIESGSKQKRVGTLRRVTNLFLRDSDRFSEAQIAVFDDVLCHLIKRIETKALAELSTRLAPIGNAPTELIRRLARNDDIAIAAPVLAQSERLTADDLIEIAQTKGQAHLLAISGRPQLEESVTDQLLSRGNLEVIQTLARNVGARFSETGFTTLVKRAETDDSLAKGVGLRLDLPLRLLRELLSRATEAVRSWLMANAPTEVKDEIQRIVSAISIEVGREVITPRDFSHAQQLIRSIRKRGELNETVLLEFANARKYEETVAALAELSSVSIQTIAAVMRSERNDGILIPCRAIGLQWSTVSTILNTRIAHHCIPDHELDQVKADYLILSRKSAQRTLRFWQVRERVIVDGRTE